MLQSTHIKIGFNSRSREGATRRGFAAYKRRRVSIHAPRRGSDFLLFSPVLPYTVSIHAYLKSGSAAHIFYNAARQMPASRIPTRSVRLSARRLQTRKTDSTHNFLSPDVFFAKAVIVYDKVDILIAPAG